MSWSGLANNQMVSYADAQSSGFTLNPGQTNPGTNQCMTKTDATTKYSLPNNVFSSYASNQLVPKGSWSVYAYTFGTLETFDPTTSCAASNTGLTLYSASPTLVVGSLLYNNSALTSPFGPEHSYWHSGTNSYLVDYPNTIMSITSCNSVPMVPINVTYGMFNYFNTYMELYYTYSILVESPSQGNYLLVDYTTYYSSDVDDNYYISTYVPNDATLFINLDVEIYNPSGRLNYVYNDMYDQYWYTMYYDNTGTADVGAPYTSSTILDLNDYDLTGITLQTEGEILLDV